MTDYVLFEGQACEVVDTLRKSLDKTPFLIVIDDGTRRRSIKVSECVFLDPLKAFAILAQQETKS